VIQDGLAGSLRMAGGNLLKNGPVLVEDRAVNIGFLAAVFPEVEEAFDQGDLPVIMSLGRPDRMEVQGQGAGQGPEEMEGVAAYR